VAAGLHEQIDTAARNAAVSGDPNAIGAAEITIRNLAKYGEDYGALKPGTGYAAQRQALDKMVRGAADNLITKGQPAEAMALLDKHPDAVDPVAADVLRRRAEGKNVSIEGDGLANWALGLGPAPSLRSGGGGKVERFLDLADAKESGGRNIEQQVVGPSGGYNPSTGTVTGPSTASGRFQITDTTWKSFAPQAGVDLDKYPRAISAPYDVQRQVARTIATTSGVQHWTDYNKELRSAAASQGLPVSGPIQDSAAGAMPGTQAASIAAPDTGGTDAGTENPPPGAQGGGPQQNRTGLPQLSDVWSKIQNSGAGDLAKEHAWRTAVTKYNALEADAARSERLAVAAQKQRLEQRTNEIYADAYSGNPQITAQQIAVDPAFNAQPERRKQMIDLINNPPGSGIPAPRSYAAAQSLIDRIRLPDGDPNKITDVGQIYDNMHSLNRSDFEFVRKEFDQIRTPGGELFGRRKSDFVKSVAPLIDKSNPLMGKIDQSGKTQLYSFEWALDQKIEEYRKAGKNPVDLLDPSKPDFMGKPEAIEQYRKPLQQSLKTLRDQVRTTTGTAPPAAAPPAPLKPNSFAAPGASQPQSTPPVATASIPPPGAPGAVPRNPGESPADYLKRIGAAPPGTR
jgi:hypothetical protein